MSAYRKWMEDSGRSAFNPYDTARWSMAELNELMGDLEHPGQEGDRIKATRAWEARRTGAPEPRDALGRTASEVYALRDAIGPVALEAEYTAQRNAAAKAAAAAQGITLVTSTDAPAAQGVFRASTPEQVAQAVELGYVHPSTQAEVVRLQTIMDERKGETIPVPVVAPEITPIAGEKMSLGSVLSGIGKTALGVATGGLAGGVAAGIQSLMDSRRDGPKTAPMIPGMGITGFEVPGIEDAIQRIKDYAANSYQSGLTGANILLGNKAGPLGGESPNTVKVTIRRCRKGYALGLDGKCYPKAVLRKDLRMWKPDPKPVVSRTDQKAIRRAAAAKGRLVKITRDAGAFASLHKPKQLKKPGRK